MAPQPPCTPEEHMAVLLSHQVRDGETSACGVVSPIPAAGLLLAEQTHAPHAQIIILGSEAYDPFVRKGNSGSTEFHFMAQRGELDLFFVSGIQIDREGNFNIHLLGEHDAPTMRLPGAFGTGMLYYMAKRVVLFRTEHTKRTFVNKVDFISGAGATPENVYRGGGPATLVTPMAVLDWDRDAKEWTLQSVHPGHTVQDVLDNMEFTPRVRAPVATSPEPTQEELRLLRTVVREKVSEVYPEFARLSIMEPV